MSFQQYVLKEQYGRVRGLGDRLELMKDQINWDSFVPLVSSVFHDNETTGGRPHTDETVVVRCMLLQAWYGLSDEELEFQCCDRLSFRNFLGFPESIPDFSTLWRIRERLREAGVEDSIWAELQHQLDSRGYKVKKGVIQDACFIEADLGRKRHQKEKKAKKSGEKIKYSGKQESHIDRDASFSIKGGQVHYGYKNHIKVDIDSYLIRDFELTTASVHDSQVDLVREGDVGAYRDKGYFGSSLNAEGVEDKTMARNTRARKLNGGQQKRNRSIGRIRAPGERPFAVIKRVFGGGYTFVKKQSRVRIRELFKCFAYNLYQLVTLRRKEMGFIKRHSIQAV